jgi:hypothetical protein
VDAADQSRAGVLLTGNRVRLTFEQIQLVWRIGENRIQLLQLL